MSPRVPRRGVGEEGIALLIVLLTITLLTIVVVEFTQSAEVATHFAMSTRNAVQAYYLARSGVNVAEALLVHDRKINNNDSDQDIWALPMPPLPIGDGMVALRVQDEARRLNLNSMVSAVSGENARNRAVFARLFDVLGVDKRILAAIVDWLDDDDVPSSDPPGAEQSYYVGLTPPVVVRNGPMLTLRELLQVRDMTPTLFARLEEFVTVLPTKTAFKVNVNTAPAEVLYALSDGLTADPGVVDRLIAARRLTPFTNLTTDLPEVTGFTAALGSQNIAMLDIKSPYFRIDAVGQVNDVARGIVTIVGRDDIGRGKSIKRITWAPSTANLSLTSQPPSDFLETLPPLGGN